MSVFLLEKSADYLERGLKQAREGDLKQARQNLLKAAEFLYKAAEQSEPWSKQKRIERAEAIIKKAEALEQGAARTPVDVSQAEGDTAAEWLVFERPRLKLTDVAGLEDAKQQIRIKMIYPFTHPELAERFGVKKGGGLLLYGPPGTGKTMLARAVAAEIDAPFFAVRPSDIMSKWVGEAEQNIARLFSAARKHDRAIVFIDEVESLIPKRSGSGSTVMQRVVPQILSEMEGFGKTEDTGHVMLFLGATNVPWALDEAVMRPGRFDERIYVPLPDYDARLVILRSNLGGKPLSSDVSIEEIAELLEGYSGADIRRICEKATEIPFVESVTTGEERDIEKRDLLNAIKDTAPSVSRQMIEKFTKFTEQGA